MMEFPDEDSPDLTPEELTSCIEVPAMDQMAKMMIHCCSTCNEPMKPKHFQRRKLKPDHFIRVTSQCVNEHQGVRLYKVNWLST